MKSVLKEAGINRQAVSQYLKQESVFQERLSGLNFEADILRSEHPGCG